MEFPGLGKQCHHCKQLDFLPFKCPKCEYVFCKEHFKYDHHDCIKHNISRHTEIPKAYPKPKTWKCNFCKRKELIDLKCSWCNQQTCIKHRFPTDHKCEKQKKQIFRKQSVKNDIKRLDKREKKLQRKYLKERCKVS